MVLEHLSIQAQIGDQRLETVDLVLKLLEPPHLVWKQTRKRLLPIEVGRPADARLSTGLRNWKNFAAPLENIRLLCV